MKNLILLLFLGLMATGCEKVFFKPVPENSPEALFEEFWTSFNKNYAGFEERGVDWNHIYDLYRPQVDTGTTESELLEIFKQMLRPLNDGHVKLITPLEEKVFNSNLIYDQLIDDDLFDLDLIKSNYLEGNYTINGNGGNTYGRIGNVGYLYLSYIHENLLVFNDIIDEFADTDGLIIDLRHNTGGDFTYAFAEFGRLLEYGWVVFRSKTKNGPGPDDYTEWHNWRIDPSGEFFDKPIVLITDRYTISAGERAAMAVKTLPNVTHVGDTTNGAFSTLIGMELQNGWYYSVAPQKVMFSDGQYYEGIGLIPDIRVKNRPADMADGHDQTLETALAEF